MGHVDTAIEGVGKRAGDNGDEGSHMIYIGVDPPHGIAVVYDGKLVEVLTVSGLKEIFERIWAENGQEETCVVVEIPHGIGSRRGRGMPINVQRKISANIGMVYQSAKAIEAFCQTFEILVELKTPIKALTKISAKRFNEITGWKKKSSEHGRDASVLLLDKLE